MEIYDDNAEPVQNLTELLAVIGNQRRRRSFNLSGGGTLLVHEELRKSDDVHEQDVADLELSVLFELSTHFRAAVGSQEMISASHSSVEIK